MIYADMRILFYANILFCLILNMSCEQRFGKSPVFTLNANMTSNEKVEAYSNREIKALDSRELTQYLNIHAKANWANVTEEDILEYVSDIDSNPRQLELISDYYVSKGDFEQALVYNTAAEDNGANTVDFYKKRAHIYSALGQYGLAVDYINKAVTINGNDPDIYLTKGEVYLNFGDSISSLKYKEQAYTNDSSRHDIAVDLAYLYANVGQNQKSRELVDLLIMDDYKVSEMQQLKVDLYRKTGEHQEANQLLSTLLNTGNLAAGENLIDFFETNNMTDSVIYYATQVLDQDSVNMTALYAKANSFDKKGYFASALMYYEQMLSIDSLSEEALDGVGKVNRKIAYLRKLKEQREAIPTFDFASPRKETN